MRARQQKPKDASALEELLSGGGRIDTRRRGNGSGTPSRLALRAKNPEQPPARVTAECTMRLVR
jgi:hypothetical protein